MPYNMELVVITDVMRNHLRRVEFLTAFSRRFACQHRKMQNKSKEQRKNSFQNSLIFLFGFQRITEGLCFKTKRFLKIAAKIDTISGFGQDFTQDSCMDCKKSTERGVFRQSSSSFFRAGWNQQQEQQKDNR